MLSLSTRVCVCVCVCVCVYVCVSVMCLCTKEHMFEWVCLSIEKKETAGRRLTSSSVKVL